VVRTGLPRRIPFVPSDLIGRSTVAGVEFPGVSRFLIGFGPLIQGSPDSTVEAQILRR
jgi:hypothetical protein